MNLRPPRHVLPYVHRGGFFYVYMIIEPHTQTRIGVTHTRRMRRTRIYAPAHAICLYDYLTTHTLYYI